MSIEDKDIAGLCAAVDGLAKVSERMRMTTIEYLIDRFIRQPRLGAMEAKEQQQTDAPPVPEKDWWYGREKMPDKVDNVLFWLEAERAWCACKTDRIKSYDIWRYQPPAPSVTRTEVGEGGAAK